MILFSSGGWFGRKWLYLRIQLSNEFWTYSKPNETQVSLFFIGWFQREKPQKLFSIVLLWLNIQIGWNSVNDQNQNNVDQVEVIKTP